MWSPFGNNSVDIRDAKILQFTEHDEGDATDDPIITLTLDQPDLPRNYFDQIIVRDHSGAEIYDLRTLASGPNNDCAVYQAVAVSGVSTLQRGTSYVFSNVTAQGKTSQNPIANIPSPGGSDTRSFMVDFLKATTTSIATIFDVDGYEDAYWTAPPGVGDSDFFGYAERTSDSGETPLIVIDTDNADFNFNPNIRYREDDKFVLVGEMWKTVAGNNSNYVFALDKAGRAQNWIDTIELYNGVILLGSFDMSAADSFDAAYTFDDGSIGTAWFFESTTKGLFQGLHGSGAITMKTIYSNTEPAL